MNCSYATATRNERIVNYLEVAERKITFTRGIKSLVSIYLLILKKKKSLYEITLLNDPKKLIDYYISKVDLSNWKKKKEKKKKRKASKISRKIQKMGCWKEREEEDKKNFPFYRSNLRDKPSSKRSHVDFHRRSFIRESGKVSSVRNRFLGEEDKKKENGEDKGGRQALGDLLNTLWWRWCAQTFAILYSSSFKGRIRIVLEEQERT